MVCVHVCASAEACNDSRSACVFPEVVPNGLSEVGGNNDKPLGGPLTVEGVKLNAPAAGE